MKTCGKTLKNLTSAPGANLSNSSTTTEHRPSALHHNLAHGSTLFFKSHRGTFLGFVVMAGMFMSIVLFFFAAHGDEENTDVKLQDLFLVVVLNV